MNEELEIINLIQKHMGWELDKAILWMETPNPHFGCVEPMYLIQLGRGHKVLEFVKGAIESNKP